MPVEPLSDTDTYPAAWPHLLSMGRVLLLLMEGFPTHCAYALWCSCCVPCLKEPCNLKPSLLLAAETQTDLKGPRCDGGLGYESFHASFI